MFHDSPANRDDFTTETESTQFSQCFFCTRYKRFVTTTNFITFLPYVLDFHWAATRYPDTR